MHFPARRYLALLLALLAFAAIGCGGDSNTAGTTTTSSGPTTQERSKPGPAAQIRSFLRRKFSEEKWYPLVNVVEIVSGRGVVSTYIEGSGPKDLRTANQICDAVLASKVVKEASILYGEGSTAFC